MAKAETGGAGARNMGAERHRRGASALALAAGAGLWLSGLGAGGAAAQITATTGAAGTGTVVGGTTGATTISGGTAAGANLFHTFDDFNINRGASATFEDAAAAGGIQNLIARVIGGDVSRLEGQLTVSSASYPGANFYFINPAGMVVTDGFSYSGAGGDLHLSTARELAFADGIRWSTDGTGANTLTAAAPSAFGFLAGAPSGDITVDFSGNPGGQTVRLTADGGDGLVTLTAANISFTGNETSGAFGDRLNIAADRLSIVAAGDSASLDVANTFDSLLGATAQLDQLGTIGFSEFSLSQIGIGSDFSASAGTALLGRTIDLRAGTPNGFMTTGVLLDPGSRLFVTADTLRMQNNAFLEAGADTKIEAGTLEMVSPDGGTPSLRVNGADGAGDLTIAVAGDATLDGADISTGRGALAFSAGGSLSFADTVLWTQGGDIGITSGGAMTGTDFNVQSVSTGDGGAAGDLALSAAGNLSLTGGFLISSSDGGDSGAIRLSGADVDVSNTQLRSRSNSAGGLGGLIEVAATGTLTAADINAESSGLGGSAGILLDAGAGMTLDNAFLSTRRQGLSGFGSGSTGDIILRTADGAIAANAIAFETTRNFDADSTDPGENGDIRIIAGGSGGVSLCTTANFCSLDTRANGAADAGDLLIDSGTGDLAIGSLGSFVSVDTETLGSGAGGDLVLRGANVTLLGFQGDSGSEGDGDGGDIIVEAGGAFVMGDPAATIGNFGSVLRAGAFEGGVAGDITIDAGSIALLGSAPLLASDFGDPEAGQRSEGGTITLTAAGDVSASNGSNIQASGAAAGGAILITAGGDILIGEEGEFRSLSPYADGPGGRLALTAGGDVRLTNTFALARGGDISVDAGGQFALVETSLNATGIESAGGSIEIDAGSFAADGASSISASGLSFAADPSDLEDLDGGTITIRTAGDIDSDASISANGYGINSSDGFTLLGNGGLISLEAGGDLRLGGADGARAFLDAEGRRGGTVDLRAGGSVTLQNAQIDVRGLGGDGGTIDVSALSLSADANTALLADAAFGEGSNSRGGTVTVRTVGDLDFGGRLIADSSSGAGGAILLEAGGALTLVEEEGRFAFLDADGRSAAGRIELSGASVLIDGFSISADTFDEEGSVGGDILIRSADAGAIVVRDASVDATGHRGGTVILNAGGAAVLRDAFFNVHSSGGDGGTIDISALSLSANGGTGIRAGTAFEDGADSRGGTVTVRTAGDLDFAGVIDVDSRSGAGGAILLEAGGALTLVEEEGGFAILDADGRSAGGRIELSGASVLIGGFTIDADASAPEESVGGGILIRSAEDGAITIAGTFISARGTRGGSIALSGGSADLEGSSVNVFGSGDDGRGGSIDIDVVGALEMTGSQAFANSSGDGGEITVDAGSFTAVDSLLFANSVGAGGRVLVSVDGALLMDRSRFQASGNTAGDPQSGGTIAVDAGSVTLRDSPGGLFVDTGEGASITVTSGSTITIDNSEVFVRSNSSDPDRLRPGTGGATVTLSAPGEITVTGPRSVLAVESSLTFDPDTEAFVALNDDGSTLVIEGGSFRLADGARVFGRVWGEGAPARIEINAAGGVVIDGGRIDLSNDPNFNENVILTNTDPSAGGGTLVITADGILVGNGSLITADAFGTGEAGSLTLQATGASPRALEVSGESRIQANGNGRASGGEVALLSGGGLVLNTAAVQAMSGTGEAGDDGESEEETAPAGDAGTIRLGADGTLFLSRAEIDASALAGGAGGSVTIGANGGLVETPPPPRLPVPGRGPGQTDPDDGKSGLDTIPEAPGTFTIRADASGEGARAGSIIIEGAELFVPDGSVISASGADGAAGGLVSLTTPGDLSVGAARIAASGRSGGAVALGAGQTLSLGQGARVTADAEDGARGGVMLAGRRVVADGAEISADAANADTAPGAGGVTVAGSRLELGGGTTLSADNSAGGSGGRVRLMGGEVVLGDAEARAGENGGGVTLSASGSEGAGGLVEVAGTGLTIREGVSISATGAPGGLVTFDVDTVDPDDEDAMIEGAVVDASADGTVVINGEVSGAGGAQGLAAAACAGGVPCGPDGEGALAGRLSALEVFNPDGLADPITGEPLAAGPAHTPGILDPTPPLTEESLPEVADAEPEAELTPEAPPLTQTRDTLAPQDCSALSDDGTLIQVARARGDVPPGAPVVILDEEAGSGEAGADGFEPCIVEEGQ